MYYAKPNCLLELAWIPTGISYPRTTGWVNWAHCIRRTEAIANRPESSRSLQPAGWSEHRVSSTRSLEQNPKASHALASPFPASPWIGWGAGSGKRLRCSPRRTHSPQAISTEIYFAPNQLQSVYPGVFSFSSLPFFFSQSFCAHKAARAQRHQCDLKHDTHPPTHPLTQSPGIYGFAN